MVNGLFGELRLFSLPTQEIGFAITVTHYSLSTIHYPLFPISYSLEVKLLPSRGKQPPMMKPRATAIAKTSPQGRSIDLQNTKFMLTKLAFWTDNSAIRTIQVAEIVEIIKFVMVFAPLNSRLTSTHLY
jgi:hypothetical protein